MHSLKYENSAANKKSCPSEAKLERIETRRYSLAVVMVQ